MFKDLGRIATYEKKMREQTVELARVDNSNDMIMQEIGEEMK